MNQQKNTKRNIGFLAQVALTLRQAAEGVVDEKVPCKMQRLLHEIESREQREAGEEEDRDRSR